MDGGGVLSGWVLSRRYISTQYVRTLIAAFRSALSICLPVAIAMELDTLLEGPLRDAGMKSKMMVPSRGFSPRWWVGGGLPPVVQGPEWGPSGSPKKKLGVYFWGGGGLGS